MESCLSVRIVDGSPSITPVTTNHLIRSHDAVDVHPLQSGATNVTTDGSVTIALAIIVFLAVGLFLLRRWSGPTARESRK